MVEPESANVCGSTEFRAAQPTTPLDRPRSARRHRRVRQFLSSAVRAVRSARRHRRARQISVPAPETYVQLTDSN